MNIEKKSVWKQKTQTLCVQWQWASVTGWLWKLCKCHSGPTSSSQTSVLWYYRIVTGKKNEKDKENKYAMTTEKQAENGRKISPIAVTSQNENSEKYVPKSKLNLFATVIYTKRNARYLNQFPFKYFSTLC